MANLSLTGKDDIATAHYKESMLLLREAVIAASEGDFSSALSAMSRSREFSIAESKGLDDDVHTCLHTAVYTYLISCMNHERLEKSKKAPEVVYVIQDSVSKNIKIGFTKDLKERFSAHQTSNANKLNLIKVIKGTRQTEIKIHKALKSHLLRGEWFQWNDFVKKYIDTLGVQYNRDDIEDMYGKRDR